MYLKREIIGSFIFLLLGCSQEKAEEIKDKTKRSPTKENKELSQKTYSKLAGHWKASKIAETKEEELRSVPGKAAVFLIINKDRTFYTLLNLDTVTSGNYTVKEEFVVFNENKNYVGGQPRFLSVKPTFKEDIMELEGEWVELDGSKEYHHSSFIKSNYDPESIQLKMDSLNASK